MLKDKKVKKDGKSKRQKVATLKRDKKKNSLAPYALRSCGRRRSKIYAFLGLRITRKGEGKKEKKSSCGSLTDGRHLAELLNSRQAPA